MKTYELCIVLPEALKDSQQKGILQDIEKKVEEFGGKVGSLKKWGKRKLAYPIAGNQNGYYWLFEIQLKPQQTEELKKQLDTTESIIRYLLVVRKG